MLPLHVAASCQASEAVVAALLATYPEAAKEKTYVRPTRLPNVSMPRVHACSHSPAAPRCAG